MDDKDKVVALMQQAFDAARLEIDHLRGATKMVEPAQPVAWLVYLPSIDTQNVYDSQDDPGYVDDVTNHDDAVVTPLYQLDQRVMPFEDDAMKKKYDPLKVEKSDHPDLVGGIVWADCELDWIRAYGTRCYNHGNAKGMEAGKLLFAPKVGAGETAVTREMIGAAHALRPNA